MRSLLAAAALAALIPAARATEIPVHASYTAYFSGFPVIEAEASLRLDPAYYRMVTRMRTTGILAVFIRGEQAAEVDGAVRRQGGLGLAPEHYLVEGRWRDTHRRITMRWHGADPEILALIPAETTEREPVPPELQRGTVDTMTAMAALLHRLAETGRCDGAAAVFDGRRRTDITARTDGPDTLAAHRWGIFAGPALKCSVEGHLVAGFRTDQDRDEARKPRSATAWFARLAPDLPLLPVRIEADTGWGPVYIHLTAFGRGELPVPTQQTRN